MPDMYARRWRVRLNRGREIFKNSVLPDENVMKLVLHLLK